MGRWRRTRREVGWLDGQMEEEDVVMGKPVISLQGEFPSSGGKELNSRIIKFIPALHQEEEKYPEQRVILRLKRTATKGTVS